MDATVTKTNPLGTERIGRLILTFAVPSIISMVVNALYNIVDQIFIGQGVGYLGNGATNVIMPMTVIAIAMSLLIGDGAAAYLSLKLGEGDEKSAAKGVGCAISVMVIVGIFLCILFNVSLKPIGILFGATEDILPYAMDYGRIISYGILFSVIDSGMAGMIRADSSPKYSMAGLLVGCITNIILDPIFIFVFHWGVILCSLVCLSFRYQPAESRRGRIPLRIKCRSRTGRQKVLKQQGRQNRSSQQHWKPHRLRRKRNMIWLAGRNSRHREKIVQ